MSWKCTGIDFGMKGPGSVPGSASGQFPNWESHFAFLKLGVISFFRRVQGYLRANVYTMQDIS